MSTPGNDERRPGRGGAAVEQLNNHAQSSASGPSQDSATGCPTLVKRFVTVEEVAS